MNLEFLTEKTHMQLSSSLGKALVYGLKWIPNSPNFPLIHHKSPDECTFSLTIHPLSQSPHINEYLERGLLGELGFRTDVLSETTDAYVLWIHLPDNEFNALLQHEVSTKNTSIYVKVDISTEKKGVDENPIKQQEDLLEYFRGNRRLDLQDFLITAQLYS